MGNLHEHARSIYRGILGGAIDRVGLTPAINDLYWRIAPYFVSPVEVELAGLDAQFHVSNSQEYNRVTSDMVSEQAVIELLASEIGEDDVFFDVGANVGQYMALIAPLAKHVVGFEPHPMNAKRIRENIELNGHPATTVAAALSDASGTINLNVVRTNEYGTLGVTGPETEGDHESVEVDVFSCSDAIREFSLPLPTVIKIDVEGAELGVLHGLDGEIRERLHVVICEVHPAGLADFGAEESDIRRWFENHAKNHRTINDRGSEYHIVGEF